MKVLCLILALAVASQAAVIDPRSQWEEVAAPPAGYKMRVRFALTQENVDVLESHFWAVNDPKGARYGQFLTTQEIMAILAPTTERQDRVAAFIEGACVDAVTFEKYGDSLVAEMTVRDVNNVFQTELFTFVHKETGAAKVTARGEYTIPSLLSADVTFVSGVGGFPTPSKGPKIHTDFDEAYGGDAAYVVAESLYDIYNYGSAQVTNAESSLVLAEFTNYIAYVPSSLAYFQTQNALASNPIPTSRTIGKFQPSGGAYESNLDTQFGLASARNVTGWYWTEAGWMYDFSVALFNYAGTRPLVASISWGWSEGAQCSSIVGRCDGNTTETNIQYIRRTDVEFMKLGTAGTTIVVASGDQGAGGDGNADCLNDHHPFYPLYPASSPYVVSVGATMLANQTVEVMSKDASGTPPVCNKYNCATQGVEIACSFPDALITSGGGFSNYQPAQSYQTSAIAAYFASGVKLPASYTYNATGRGIPDVSAMGHNYLIYSGSKSPLPVDGTSCSTPVFAGIIALLNSERLSSGLAPVGFANPLIYQMWAENEGVFNDITQGNNMCTEFCCNKVGYEATTGWDPVTGVGSPNVSELLKVATALGKPRREL